MSNSPKVTPEDAQKAIEQQILGKRTDPNEGKITAQKFTIDGPIYYVRKGGVDFAMKPPPVEITEMPKDFKSKHERAMLLMESCINQVKAIKARQIPLTRKELLESGANKQILKELERMGFIQQQIIAVTREKDNKNVGGMVCIWFTPFGHAYINKRIKDGQGLSS